MDRLDPKRLGFVIYLGLRMHQFQKYRLLKQDLTKYVKAIGSPILTRPIHTYLVYVIIFRHKNYKAKHQKNHQVIDVGLNNQSSKGFGCHSNDPNCTAVKGQLISKANFLFFHLNQKPNKIIFDFCPSL